MTNMPSAIAELNLSDSDVTTRSVPLCHSCLHEEFGGNKLDSARNIEKLFFHTYDPITRRDIVHQNDVPDPAPGSDGDSVSYSLEEKARCSFCGEYTPNCEDIEVNNAQCVRQQLRYTRLEAVLCASLFGQSKSQESVSYCADCQSENVKWLSYARLDPLVGRYVWADEDPERFVCNSCGGEDEASTDRPLNAHEHVALITKRTSRFEEVSAEYEGIMKWLLETSFVSAEVIAQIEHDVSEIDQNRRWFT